MKIYISGMGAISAIGNNVQENLNALIAGSGGIQRGAKPSTERFLLGEISNSNQELEQEFKIPFKGSRTALLAYIAAKEAFRGQDPKLVRTGFISGTSVGGMDVTECEYAAFINGEQENLNNYAHHSSGTGSMLIAKALGIDLYINTISTACSSAANAIMLGARMIRQGQLDRVIVGGTDSLSNFTIAGFRSLMIFDDQLCRPFDADRKGLNLGEGAGFLVLESESSLKQTGNQALAELSGWCSASDAYHQTASSPEAIGATLSMRGALTIAQLQSGDIDYINVHGTATPNNDLSESVGLMNVFGQQIPPFSSTKAYTGHTLAASGGIEAVYSILAIQNGLLYPNLRFETPIDECGLIPQRTLEQGKSIRHVMSNSFGFGGNNSTLVFSAI